MAMTTVRSKPTSGLARMMAQSDVLLAMAVVGIVAMMVIPLPASILDLFQVINIATALTILLVSMYIVEPLEFSVFPSLLLVTTLFRLALNVSATRLILLNGHAGQVIEAFGGFVVGGNYVVGVVVFLILVVIQFVVITNGAGRVAEVAARFTLDAMPGKQMSIDADLNAGLISEQDARRRRRAIEQEADFYGAMDGASKFVKGDAVAGIIIIVINIIGGFIIGVAQRGMNIGDAIQSYTLLTVGDGLVTQIPALLISTATGIVVTRSASESNLGHDVASQILANPRVLGIVAGIMGAFALIPALPKLPFLGAAAVIGGVAWVSRKSVVVEPESAEESRPSVEPTEKETALSLLQVDPMEVEIGYGLIPLVEQKPGGLLARVTTIRKQVAQELGIVVPTVRIRDNLQLGPNAYVVRLRGVEIGRGELMINRYLALGMSWEDARVDGVKTTDPAFGLPAVWIAEADRECAETTGYTVVDAISVFSTHFTELVKGFAPLILGRQDVQALLDNVRTSSPAVLEELIPGVMTAGELHKVLQNLLRERVSIRNLVTILEALAVEARMSRDSDVLSEQVRRALGREICSQLKESDGAIHVITVSPEAEQLIANTLQADRGSMVALEPGVAHRMLQQMSAEIQKTSEAGHLPVILCSGRTRLALKRMTERSMPTLVVLSFAEVPGDFKVQCEGTVSLREEV